MDDGPARWVVAVAGLLEVGLLLLVLLSGGQPEGTPEPVDPKRTAGSSGPPARGAAKADPYLADELGAIATAGVGEDTDAPDGSRATEANVAATTRCFLGSYLRYELGQPVSPRELRRSASGALVEDLLADPPRFPPGLDRRPLRATVTQIDAIEAASDRSASARPHATAVVRLDRAGAPEAAAFTLRKSPEGRWLVTGVRG